MQALVRFVWASSFLLFAVLPPSKLDHLAEYAGNVYSTFFCTVFRQQVEVVPVPLASPLLGFGTQTSRSPLGVPFASYRTVVGAGLASWVLGMTTTQDLLSLITAAVRDLRSLGPPTHCWQRSVVNEMLADVVVSACFLVSEAPSSAELGRLALSV